ncbi:unnamed protein product [Ixodes persulcatus]
MLRASWTFCTLPVTSVARSLVSSPLLNVLPGASSVGVRRLSQQRQQTARPRGRNGFEQRANAIFDEVREIRRKSETGDFEVPKLFLVERLSREFGLPYWEKDILKVLKLLESKEDKKAGIHRPVGSVAIVKNTPFMCRMLWRVKHLVRVTPITFPDGEPREGEYAGTHLGRDGVFRRVPHIDELRLAATEPERKKLDGKEIAKVLHLAWNNSL